MPHLYLDFETRSELSLAGPKGVGTYAYAEHPSTEVMCLAWALDDDAVQLWTPDMDDDPHADAAGANDWRSLMQQDDVTCVAHNCEFERAIFRYKLELDTPVGRWEDTAALCARISIPRKLEEAAKALGLDVQKDMEGNRVMQKLSKPRRPTKDDSARFWTPQSKPDDFERLYRYCMTDVEVMRKVHRRVPKLSEREHTIWRLTVEANERGVPTDVASVPRALHLANTVADRLVAEFTRITGVNPNNPTKAAMVLGLPDFTEDTVRKALHRTDLAPNVRKALEIRQLQAYSSLKKLDAFATRTSRDGRIRGSLIYSGAERTQRWSAAGVQPQNFPSAVLKDMDRAFAALEADCFDLVYDDVLGSLSGILRGFFTGPFLVGDLAQVEARNTAWLAKQYDLVDSFAKGSDPYKQMAAVIYNVKFEQVTKPQREVGKRAILGCGYGMGADKFQRSLDEQYGIQITPELAKRTVDAYRSHYPKIPKLWRDLGAGFELAVRGKHAKVQAGPVEMGMTEIAGREFAYIRLPSGRALFYGWPVIRQGKHGSEVWYFGRNHYAKTWGPVSTWGGKLAENIVQALSRDLLADIMIRADEAGFPMALTVHDELVAYGKPEDLDRFKEVFRRKPAWAQTLAVGAECFASYRYRK